MSVKTIYDALIDAGLTAEGACGVLGNMKAESNMQSNIAQRGMTNLSDAEYTKAADNGKINFVHDAVGYGLCQWTYHTRKRDLLQFSKNWGVSVGAEDMQVEFFLHEMRESYPKLLKFLSETHDLMTATERVCKEYERPAINNVAVRYEYAQEFFEECAASGGEEVKDSPPDPTIMMLQMILSYNGYSVKITGYKDNTTLDALQSFICELRG